MSDWKIRRAPAIHAEITVPGDKSISHRAVMLAAMSNGPCVIRGFLASEDCLSTVEAIRSLGIEIERPDDETLIVHGKRRVFTAPRRDIDSGTPAQRCACWPESLQGSRFAAGSSATRRFRNVR